MACNHLDPDEHENQRKAVIQEPEQLHQPSQRKIHRPKAQDGERVRTEGNERVERYSENRRDRVQREHNIRRFDHHKDYKKRRNHPLLTNLQKEMARVVPFGDREKPLERPKDGVLFDVHLLIFWKTSRMPV